MKVGGSFKTFVAKLYKNGSFVLDKPYWRIEYYNNDILVCTVKFIYVNDQLVCDNSDGDFIIDGNKIICERDSEQLFGIKYIYDYGNPMDLKLKCLPIINMIGGRMVLSVDDDSTEVLTHPATLTVEVEGL